jgi:hypothetical protein
LKTLEGNAAVFIGHAANQRAVGEESNVHGREGKQSVHHIWGCGTYPEKSGNMASPEGEVVCIDGSQLVIQGRNMIDQTEILDRVQMRHGGRVYSKAGEWKDACSLPFSNGSFDLRCPHQVGLVGSGGAFRIRNLHVIVRASNLVLSTVAALREVFITTNVSALAGITALARLGVAAARRTTTGTGHFEELKAKVR